MKVKITKNHTDKCLAKAKDGTCMMDSDSDNCIIYEIHNGCIYESVPWEKEK